MEDLTMPFVLITDEATQETYFMHVHKVDLPAEEDPWELWQDCGGES